VVLSSPGGGPLGVVLNPLGGGPLGVVLNSLGGGPLGVVLSSLGTVDGGGVVIITVSKGLVVALGLFGVDGPWSTFDDDSSSFASFNNSENDFDPVKAENPEVAALNASNPPLDGALVSVVGVVVVGAKADLATPNFGGMPNAGSPANCGLAGPSWEGAPKPLDMTVVVGAPAAPRSSNTVTAGTLASGFLKNGDDSCRGPNALNFADDCWRKPGAGAFEAVPVFFRSKGKSELDSSGDDGGDTMPEGGPLTRF